MASTPSTESESSGLPPVMTHPSDATEAMVVDVCDRCGRSFPHTEETESGHTFCEPCRDALWRDERRLPPRSAEVE